jgi:hypothetical protein
MTKSKEILDKVKIKTGRLIRVENTQRPKFSNANTTYYAVWVENANGKNERCLLFTEKEIVEAESRASRNKEDLTKKDFLTNFLD